MYARAVDDAAIRLRELRREEWGDLGLGALALGFSVVATQVHPSLALPLFIGGLVVGALGMRALWRRWDLVEQLAGDPDAYLITEVLEFASREATMEKRQALAALIRGRLTEPREVRVCAAADELEALVSELEDRDLALDPASAVVCMRLLSDIADSPLLNRALPPEDLASCVRRIRCGFRPRRLQPDSYGDAGRRGPASENPKSTSRRRRVRPNAGRTTMVNGALGLGAVGLVLRQLRRHGR
jgi:hypothetical protein